ncbi:MAG: hypothetical protein AAGI34_15650 [Pseudomonadota bacterium]
MRRIDELFAQIASFPALITAAKRAARGKRRTPGASTFLADLEPAYLALERSL